MLRTSSVAVARMSVAVSSSTAIGSPGEARSVAGPTATGDPMHPAVANSATVDPASAVPLTSGAFSLAGEPGSTAVSTGGSGGVESGGGSPTGTVCCFSSPSLSSSTTASRTTWSPGPSKTCCAVGSVPSSKSPSSSRSHATDWIVPSGSAASDVNATLSPVSGLTGS